MQEKDVDLRACGVGVLRAEHVRIIASNLGIRVLGVRHRVWHLHGRNL